MSDIIVQSGQEVVGVSRIAGPIMIVEGAANVSYDEVVEIRDGQGNLRRGRVLEVGEKTCVVQIFAGSTGLSIDGTRVRFLGDTLRIPVAEEMLGRVFDGLGNPLDGGPPKTNVGEATWERTGETFAALTVRPSIQRVGGCRWHGFISNGEIASA